MCASFPENANYPKNQREKILRSPDHWVLVSFDMSNRHSLTVYDSLHFDPKTRQQVLACMSWPGPKRKMDFIIVPCFRQKIHSNDCGFLAIAFAVCLANDLANHLFYFPFSTNKSNWKRWGKSFSFRAQENVETVQGYHDRACNLLLQKNRFLGTKKTTPSGKPLLALPVTSNNIGCAVKVFRKKWKNMDIPWTFIETYCTLSLYRWEKCRKRTDFNRPSTELGIPGNL